jgi:hypothetical protein
MTDIQKLVVQRPRNIRELDMLNSARPEHRIVEVRYISDDERIHESGLHLYCGSRNLDLKKGTMHSFVSFVEKIQHQIRNYEGIVKPSSFSNGVIGLNVSYGGRYELLTPNNQKFNEYYEQFLNAGLIFETEEVKD